MLTTLSNLAGTVANSLAGAIAGKTTLTPTLTPTLSLTHPRFTHPSPSTSMSYVPSLLPSPSHDTLYPIASQPAFPPSGSFQHFLFSSTLYITSPSLTISVLSPSHISPSSPPLPAPTSAISLSFLCSALLCFVGVWDVSNETLAGHDYTGMWKLTLLCGCVQLLGEWRVLECSAVQCSVV